MIKKIGKLWLAFIIALLVNPWLFPDIPEHQGKIRRLTRSGNHSVHFPCLSDDGRWMLYVRKASDGDVTTQSLRIMNVDTGEEKELYLDKQETAPEPYENVPLILGTKPPLLSGDGLVAFFILSLDQPEKILDHYLAMIHTDGSGFKVFSFPIENLQGKDWKSLDFKGNEWERIAQYAASTDGHRVACVMKGHFGPIRYMNASAIVLLDTGTEEMRTILAPIFNGKQWEWESYPSHPLLGGGWAFGISGQGDRILFGARSSEDERDYDLYLSDWGGDRLQKITDFQDRWFSQAELSQDGEKVVFYYAGTKKQGLGTYVVASDASSLRHLEDPRSPHFAFYDLSGNGKYILYRFIYDGMFLDCDNDEEGVLFDPETQGYVKGSIPMDFPPFPAFWEPKIMSYEGTRIVLSGIPEGKQSPEFYLLGFEERN